jgi:transposase
MADNNPLSSEHRWAIIGLHKHAGWKQERIAKAIHCTRETVSHIIKKYSSTGSVEDLPRSGRPPSIDVTNSEDNVITNTIRKKRKSTAKAVQRDLETELNITISSSTIANLRRALGFRPVHYRRRPIISNTNKHKRYQYCLDNMDEDWKNIIFTDESMFILTDEHEVIWKRPGSPCIERPTAQYPKKQMIWGGIWWDGRTDLCFVDGIVDQYQYQEILLHYLIRPHLDDGKEVLQDGAKAHTADSTWEFIDENGVHMIQNPPRSPDLNPIEKVWGWIKHEVNKHNPSTVDELKELIQKYWNEIPQTTIQQFINHNIQFLKSCLT